MPETQWIRVGTPDEIEAQGIAVVSGPTHPIAVILHEGRVVAIDNRCPHMGFPLHRGTVKHGILTCHWHEASFDLASGCTFDLWADDVPMHDTRIVDGVVEVASAPRQRPTAETERARLERGMKQSVSLVQAKALLGLAEFETDLHALLSHVTDFTEAHLDAWREGMTRLVCVANLWPHLRRETRYHAMLYATRQIAADAEDATPHRRREPLGEGGHHLDDLRRWLTQWTWTRHSDGAERTVLTALRDLPSAAAWGDLIHGACGERVFADTGHLFDFANKAFELCDHLGPEAAPRFFPLLMGTLTGARGAEESTHWHHPVEIIEPLRELERSLPKNMASAPTVHPDADADLPDTLLGDDPLAILRTLESHLSRGVTADVLSRHVCHAAGLRLAQFAPSNDVRDWFNPQHTFIFANAVHEAIRRSPRSAVVRSLFHAAIAVYQDRFLNVPPAALPRGSDLENLPSDAKGLRSAILATLDQRAALEPCARLVAKHFRAGLPLGELIDTLALATVREDLDFHSLQVLEAAVRQAAHWGDPSLPEVEHLFVGVARNLAAHCPTQRAGHQVAMIALRLHRGDNLHEGEG